MFLRKLEDPQFLISLETLGSSERPSANVICFGKAVIEVRPTTLRHIALEVQRWII